jgi:hypothetical protein
MTFVVPKLADPQNLTLQHQQLHQRSQNQPAASQFHGFTVRGVGGDAFSIKAQRN